MNIQTREMVIDTRTATADRTVAVSISSDIPLDRYDYVEILSHDAKAIDLSRAPLPLVEGHDTSKVNVGIIEGLRTDGKKLRGILRMGASQRATELWADIQSGVVRGLSVGYEILSHTTNGKTVTATRWKPYETSLVAVPADNSVGIGRSHTFNLEHQNMNTENTFDPAQAGRIARESEQRELQRLRTNEDLRILGDQFREFGGVELAETCMRTGANADDLKDLVLRRMQTVRALPLAEPDYSSPLSDQRGHFPDNAQISGGVPVAMKNIYGASKRGLWAFGENTREQQQGAYKAGMFLASIVGNSDAQKWIKQRGYNMRAASTSNNTAGGFAVPEEMSNAVINNRDVFGVARKIVRVVPMGSDVTRVPVQASAASTYYITENSALSESDITWGEVALIAKKLAVMGRFSTEVLEDAVIDMASWYAAETGRAFAEAEDDAFINGDGTSTYGGMQGLINKFEAASYAGEATATTGHNLLPEIDATDLSSLIALCPAYALPNARWLMSPAFYGAVIQRLILSAGGTTLNDMVNGQAASFLGYPISISPKMPNSTTASYASKVVCMFGDFSRSSIMGTRRDLTVMVDSSRYMEFDQIAVRSTQRWVLVNHDVGTTSVVGPVVALNGN